MSKVKSPGAKGPARSGGGPNMNKNVRPPIKTGPSTANAHSPSRAAHVGRAIGDHVSSGGGKTVQRPADPIRTRPNPAPHGNAKALAVGRGSPGADRILHGQSGSQSQHGPVNPGNPMKPGADIFQSFPSPGKGGR
jgi:hypothetical protein